jgi:hypothetical protein
MDVFDEHRAAYRLQGRSAMRESQEGSGSGQCLGLDERDKL